MIKKIPILCMFTFSACATGSLDPVPNGDAGCSAYSEEISDAMEAYPFAVSQNVTYRNNFIDARLAKSQQNFCNRMLRIANRSNLFRVGGDTTKSLLGTWGTIVTGGDVSQVTNGIVTALDVTTNSINSNIYRDRNLSAIITLMEANRTGILAEIDQRKKLSMEDYTLGMAQYDLVRFESAGTLQFAEKMIAEIAQEKKEEAQIILKNEITPDTNTITRANRVRDTYAKLANLSDNEIKGLLSPPPSDTPILNTQINTFYKGNTVAGLNSKQARFILIRTLDALALTDAEGNHLALWIAKIDELSK